MTGGGSAGHVTPNLALIPSLKKLGYEIIYIGSKNGIEKEIIEKEKIKYYGISTGKLRRYFDIKNFGDPFKVVIGLFQTMVIFLREKPNVVFSNGGFVSVPVVIGAYLNRIPIIAHESDMTPGLANKISAPYCTKVCVTFPESLKFIKDNKGELTGTPIRENLFLGNKDEFKKICKFRYEKPVLLVMGGSLGSKVINDYLRESIRELTKEFNVVHICGKGNVEKKLLNFEGYIQFEFLDKELPHIYSRADLVLSRAGANAIFELLALNKPNLLIPLSKKSSRGDQILNAESFEKSGYSIVIQEEELNSARLIASLLELYSNKNKFIETMRKSNLKNSVKNIVLLIKNYSK